MTVTGATPTPFVGRDTELAALADALAPDATAATLVRVSGEAGVGKSRLVAEAVRRSGRRALVGYSSPGSLGRPFDLLLAAVEPDVRSWAEIPPGLAGVRSALIELLRGVAPELAHDGTTEPPSPGDLISAGIALVRHLDPEALVLEDLHWADVESLQVTERLLAAPEHPAVIVTYRSEDLQGRESAAELLGTMSARSAGRHLHIEPFDQSEIARLISEHTGRAASSVAVDRLRARTGGNAFFVEEVLSIDGWDDADEQHDGFPETLTETLRLRLKGLSSAGRETLAIAAVLGSPFEFDLLAAALDVDEADLIDRLRPLIERRVIVEPEIDVFRFRHELVRESILASLLGRERRRLHDRAWVATGQHRPEAFAELARHAAGSGRLDDLARLAPKGVRHYMDRGSTRQALVLAELALEHRPDDVSLRELAARAAWLTGRGEAAEAHALRWRAAARAVAEGDDVDALALLARIAFERDDYDSAARVVADMEALLADVTAPVVRARLLADLAQHDMLMGELERSVERAGDARALAEELGLDDLLLRIAVDQASAEASLPDRRTDALDTLERVAKEAEHAGDFVTATRALHNLSVHQPPDLADATLDAMSEVADRGGFDLASAVMLPVRKAGVAVDRADLHTAQQWIDRARPFVHQLKSGRYIRFYELLLRQETGIDVDREMVDDLPTNTSWAWSIRLRQAARHGTPSEVAELLADPPLADSSASLALAVSFADLIAASVPPELLAEACATLAHDGSEQMEPAVTAALLAERLGDPEAKKLLEKITEAPDGGKTGGGTLLAAEVSLALARIEMRSGRRDVGRAHAQRAADRLSRWPGRRRDEALALAANDVCSDELTGREIDVARLVSRGMTNGQIAEELFIARKTVSTHVSHILTKLAMTSRTEIATWAVRSGLAPEAA